MGEPEWDPMGRRRRKVRGSAPPLGSVNRQKEQKKRLFAAASPVFIRSKEDAGIAAELSF